MTSVERQYWRRRLPAKFQLLLERLGRVIVRENPSNLLEFAAKYLEEKLLEEEGNSYLIYLILSVKRTYFSYSCSNKI